MSDNYEDIINMPHHVSKSRGQMSRRNRAAQFAPFAALTGYGDAIEETARQQIQDMCDQRLFAGSRIRIMPDVHAGTGCTIGNFYSDFTPVLLGMAPGMTRPAAEAVYNFFAAQAELRGK